MKRLIGLVVVVFLATSLWAQDSSSASIPATTIRGYVRAIGMVEKAKLPSERNTAAWLHARVSVEHSVSESIRLRADLRTQIFYAHHLESWSGYQTGFRSADESINLHTLWWKRSHFLAHTNVERLALTQRGRNVVTTLGRQRINWGMALCWSPNDVFQAGNPFDPDYVERPGVDAIRFQRLTGSLSGFEFAFARTGAGHSRGAWRYYSNRSGYDWQAIVGWYDHQPTIGVGWAGHLSNWSFRGEAQSYLRSMNEPGQLQATVEMDRLLPNSNYTRFAVLYNLLGKTGDTDVLHPLIPQIKQLMPGNWNGLLGWSREPSLRVRYGADLYYTTASHTFILLPQLQLTFGNDWQLSLFSQIIEVLDKDHHALRFFIRAGKDFMK